MAASARHGGSVTKITTPDFIGSLISAFDPANVAGGMGEIFAGIGGVAEEGIRGINGSISDISAAGIAAILAGTPAANQLTATNAVYSLKNITLTGIDPRLGVDGDGDGVFDFTDVGAVGFVLGMADVPINGLIIARAAGLGKLPVTPLKLITV